MVRDLRSREGGNGGGQERLADPERRALCRRALGWGLLSLGVGMPGPPWGTARAATAQADLAAVAGPAARAAARAVELLGGMKRFVGQGQKVVVKPNIGFDRVPEQAANTNPEVVAEVVRMALEAGAGQVLVFDRTSNKPERCYRNSGIEAAVKGIGDPRVRIFIPDPERYIEVPIPRGVKLSRRSIYADAAAADVFINCPVAKHHVFSGVTMGLKNIMGVIGGNRQDIHEDFVHKIVDLNLARPSHLTILDATRILLNRGPEGGSLLDVGRPGIVIAGANVVAVDAYGTRLFGVRPEDIPHILQAGRRGLGPIDLRQVSLREELSP